MSHETHTERFFAHGIENYGTFHGNYLNFGLWENNITDYVQAAEHLLTRVAHKIKLNKNSIVVDIGCGMGAQDLFFMRTFQCKTITALDLTRKHIRVAQSRNIYPQLTYQVGNACDLPYPTQQFTHAIGIEAPVNFNTREKFMQEAFRVLKPGGKLGMSDYNLVRAPRNRWEKSLLNFCLWLWHIPKENADTTQQYRAKLERQGFTKIEIEVVSDTVHPGYYCEQMRKETRTQLYKIRGSVAARISLFMDWFTYRLYKKGIIGYILVSAEKKI